MTDDEQTRDAFRRMRKIGQRERIAAVRDRILTGPQLRTDVALELQSDQIRESLRRLTGDAVSAGYVVPDHEHGARWYARQVADALVVVAFGGLLAVLAACVLGLCWRVLAFAAGWS